MDEYIQEMREFWSEYWKQYFDKEKLAQKRVDAKQRRKFDEEEKTGIKRPKLKQD
jgi:hypothetical protein